MEVLRFADRLFGRHVPTPQVHPSRDLQWCAIELNLLLHSAIVVTGARVK